MSWLPVTCHVAGLAQPLSGERGGARVCAGNE